MLDCRTRERTMNDKSESENGEGHMQYARPIQRQLPPLAGFLLGLAAALGADASAGQEARPPQSLADKFKALDADGDGRVSREEYFRPNLGTKWEQASKDQAALHDLDGDGFLSLTEFACSPRGVFPAAELFPILDADGDNLLTLAEFLRYRPKAQWRGAGAAFYRSDTDASGGLNLHEFLEQGKGDRQRTDPILREVEKRLQKLETICMAAGDDKDGRLNELEWPAKKFSGIEGSLGKIPFGDWDRDGDGAVTKSERRLVVEMAFGVRLPDGQLIRKPGGYVIMRNYIRYLDADKDDALSRDEFVSRYHMKEKNAEIFAEIDKDNDGGLTYAELAAQPRFAFDAFDEFCRFDADMNGRIVKEELLAGSSTSEKAMAQRLIPGFDRNGDGGLDVEEFLMTPAANPIAPWSFVCPDKNRDGKLSAEEFYQEQSPLFFELSREYFRQFDRDHDGYLSHSEFDFQVVLEKAPHEVALKMLDTDKDGSLTVKELIDRQPRPTTDDPATKLRWEERTLLVEEAFRVADADHDGVMSAAEFGKSHALVIAADSGHAPQKSLIRTPTGGHVAGTGGQTAGTRETEETWNWRFLSIVGCNVLLVMAVAWMVVKRR
jgi:Ca2+-binding EF-hand superfamily protein